MKIYVASSWKTDISGLVYTLRQAGHAVYDFKNPNGFQTKDDGTCSQGGFSWSEVDPNWKTWTPAEYKSNLVLSPAAKRGFDRDMDALKDCDAVVLKRPCGASAHSEAGWAAGAGKMVIVYMEGTAFPAAGAELMYRMFNYIAVDIAEVIDALTRKSVGFFKEAL